MKFFGFVLALVPHGVFLATVIFLLSPDLNTATPPLGQWSDWVFLPIAFLVSLVWMSALALEYKYLVHPDKDDPEPDNGLAALPRTYRGICRLSIALVATIVIADVIALGFIFLGVWPWLNVALWLVSHYFVGLKLGAFQNHDNRFISTSGVIRPVIDLNRSY